MDRDYVPRTLPAPRPATRELWASVPPELAPRLRPDLTQRALRAALRLAQRKRAIPAHMLAAHPLAVDPPRPHGRHVGLEDRPRSSAHAALTLALRKKGGRNATGRITTRHRGGGCRRRIRLVDVLRLPGDEALRRIGGGAAPRSAAHVRRAVAAMLYPPRRDRLVHSTLPSGFTSGKREKPSRDMAFDCTARLPQADCIADTPVSGAHTKNECAPPSIAARIVAAVQKRIAEAKAAVFGHQVKSFIPEPTVKLPAETRETKALAVFDDQPSATQTSSDRATVAAQPASETLSATQIALQRKRAALLLGDPRAFTVVRLEHDPCRSAKVALARNDATGLLSYVLAWDGAAPGDRFFHIRAADPRLANNPHIRAPGSTLPLAMLAPGTPVHSVELRPGRGAQLARSAGTKAVLVARDSAYATLRLPSGTVRRVPVGCRATIGTVGNRKWHLRVIGTAGRNRRLGWRPTVRGVAMNAVDHPHGGGKGGKSKGNHSQSPWGKICK